MQGTGKTYEISGETTEWEDILIKKGIKTREEVYLEKGLNPNDFIDDEDEYHEDDIDPLVKSAIKIATASEEDLEIMEEDEDEDEEKMLKDYREKRLRELKQHAAKYRFGDVIGIGKDDWLREVTEASKGAWVVVHLYQDSVIECQLVDEAMIKLAAKFKNVKFIKIRSTQAIENWPDRNLPAIFVYHDGVLNCQLVTIATIGGKKMGSDDLEWWLASNNVVETELDENPRNSSLQSKQSRTSRFITEDSDPEDD